MADMEGMLKDNALSGKTIIVTGGGTGLGKSMGKYFLELGANLVQATPFTHCARRRTTAASKEPSPGTRPCRRKHKNGHNSTTVRNHSTTAHAPYHSHSPLFAPQESAGSDWPLWRYGPQRHGHDGGSTEL